MRGCATHRQTMWLQALVSSHLCSQTTCQQPHRRRRCRRPRKGERERARRRGSGSSEPTVGGMFAWVGPITWRCVRTVLSRTAWSTGGSQEGAQLHLALHERVVCVSTAHAHTNCEPRHELATCLCTTRARAVSQGEHDAWDGNSSACVCVPLSPPLSSTQCVHQVAFEIAVVCGRAVCKAGLTESDLSIWPNFFPSTSKIDRLCDRRFGAAAADAATATHAPASMSLHRFPIIVEKDGRKEVFPHVSVAVRARSPSHTPPSLELCARAGV